MSTRLIIDRGVLIIARSITGPDGHVHDAPSIEYQLYDKGGRPASLSYRGPGAINGREVVIGDAYSEKQLLEAEMRDPTPESEDRFRGFVAGFDEKSAPKDPYKKYATKSSAWWDGYRQGLQEKKLAKSSRGLRVLGGRVVRS